MKNFRQKGIRYGKANYLFAMLWPFAGFIDSIINFRSSDAKNKFLLFCIFFGLVFIYNPDNKFETDASRYASTFEFLYLTPTTFENVWNNIYNEETNILDIYQPVLTFLLSRFTNNPHILFLTFALVFGYFYSRNIWYIFDRIKGKITLLMGVTMIMLIIVCPIWYINGVRMYTAVHVFIFGALPYLMEGSKRRLWWSIGAIFIHFSFVVPVFLLLIYMLLPKEKLVFYFVIFIVSSLIRELNISAINQFLIDNTPYIFHSKINSYLNVSNIKEGLIAQSKLHWQVILTGILNSIMVYVIVIYLFIVGRSEIKASPFFLRIFSYVLFSYSFFQVLSLVPSMGRYLLISQMMLLSTFLLFLDKNRKLKSTREVSIILIPILLSLIILNLPLHMIGFMTLVGNPLLAFIIEDTTTIIMFLKQI